MKTKIGKNDKMQESMHPKKKTMRRVKKTVIKLKDISKMKDKREKRIESKKQTRRQYKK